MSGLLRFVKTPEELRAALERRIEEVRAAEDASFMRVVARTQELCAARERYELILAHIDSVHCPDVNYDCDDDRLLEKGPVVLLTVEELRLYFEPIGDGSGT